MFCPINFTELLRGKCYEGIYFLQSVIHHGIIFKIFSDLQDRISSIFSLRQRFVLILFKTVMHVSDAARIVRAASFLSL
jgi:hypothetical protein